MMTASVKDPLLGLSKVSRGFEEETEVELKNIELQTPTARILSQQGWADCYEEQVQTPIKGNLKVVVQGDKTKLNKPAIITYHDIGMNAVSNFQTFFSYSDMKMMCENFRVFHINAPGQAEGDISLPDGYVYPTMAELAEQIHSVLDHYQIKRLVGIGVGFGANVISRFALHYPDKVDAICLINGVSTTAGWIEWGYQKLNIRSLKGGVISQGVLDFLLWHHFGKNVEERNHDLVEVYKRYFTDKINPLNLGMLFESYVARTDLGMVRELDPQKKKSANMLQMPVLLITGSHSPHVEDTVTLNSRLDPVNSTWMKLADCGIVLEEQPAKLVEALRLFLQGAGFVPYMHRRLSRSHSMMSDNSDTSEPSHPIVNGVNGHDHLKEETPSQLNSPTTPIAPMIVNPVV